MIPGCTQSRHSVNNWAPLLRALGQLFTPYLQWGRHRLFRLNLLPTACLLTSQTGSSYLTPSLTQDLRQLSSEESSWSLFCIPETQQDMKPCLFCLSRFWFCLLPSMIPALACRLVHCDPLVSVLSSTYLPGVLSKVHFWPSHSL